MRNDDPDALVDALDELLDLERAALTVGNLDRVGRLMTRKQELIESLNRSDGPEHAGLPGLRDKALRNQALLDSAMEGIRAVAARMADLRRVRERLDTYDRRGARTSLAAGSPSNLEKRA